MRFLFQSDCRIMEGLVVQCQQAEVVSYTSWEVTLFLTVYTELLSAKGRFSGLGFLFSQNVINIKMFQHLHSVTKQQFSTFWNSSAGYIFFLYIIAIQCLIFFFTHRSGPAFDCLALSSRSCRVPCISLAAEHKELSSQKSQSFKINFAMHNFYLAKLYLNSLHVFPLYLVKECL